MDDIKWVNKAKWRDAGFVVRKYEALCDSMGTDWKNDFREVLEYMVNYAIWKAEIYDEGRQGQNPMKKSKLITASTLGRTPRVILTFC